MDKFTEAKLEVAIISLLEAEGYPHVCGDSIQRASVSDVLIKADLRAFLVRQYAADGISSPMQARLSLVLDVGVPR